MWQEWMIPMEPKLAESPFQDPAFVYQVKWDGMRILAACSSDTVHLWNRKGKERTLAYPEVQLALQNSLAADDWILDGELIAFGHHGRPHFPTLVHRDRASLPDLSVPIAYVVFDCLKARGRLLTEAPLEQRQEQIAEWVQTSGVLQTCENYQDGIDLFRRMETLHLEGIVAKRRGSRYVAGKRHKDWFKVKCWRETIAVARALKLRAGQPVSILLGDTESVIGSVSSGVNHDSWRRLREYAISGSRTDGLLPLQDGIMVHVRFLEWTDDGRLRMPSVSRIDFPE